jgi:hypothetical protein
MAPPTTEKGILAYLKTFKGTVSPAWVKSNPSLKPFKGMTAVQVYYALKKANPKASPLTLGRGVTQIWIGGGLSQALGVVVSEAVTGVNATGTGSVAGLDQTAKTLGIPSTGDACLIKIPYFGGCLMTKTNVRAIVGGGLILVGGVTLLVGAAIMTANAFNNTDVGKAAKNVVREATPAGRVGKTVTKRKAAKARKEATAEKELNKKADKIPQTSKAHDDARGRAWDRGDYR